MTVQELIDELKSIPDKSLPIRYYDNEYGDDLDIGFITLEKVDFNSRFRGVEGAQFYRIKEA